ncbi:MAG: prepilin-type N-terminal cleavage/methylation domain-containing protein [Alphaproteobacteria bacterium]|nr:prepilin-type N-terminal cleavage/methylation domain-containing protein [Alphaproteobacteria bacterium]
METQSTSNKIKANKGFTLVEMAMVMIVVGLVLAGAAQLYAQKLEHMRVDNGRTDVASATQALNGFLQQNGRYPCPASLTAGVTDAGYGREMPGCNTIATSPSIGIEGVVAVAGVRNVDYTNQVTNAAFGPAVPEVYIGALPFKELNMDESAAIDGYGNKILYAVTENLAIKETYEPEDGAIEINDETGNSSLQRPGSAHFIVFTTGENGMGAYTAGRANGVLVAACAGAARETENCDMADAVFVNSKIGKATGNAEEMDDIIGYNDQSTPAWQTDLPGTGDDNLTMKTADTLGFGLGKAENPAEEIDVAGVIVVRDDPLSEDIEEGKVESSQICLYGNKEKCFPSELIGGEIANGGGMECPDGQFIVGIKHGKPICEDEVKLICPPGSVLKGITANGKLDCDTPPVKCQPFVVKECDDEQILPAAVDGTTITLTFGDYEENPRKIRYICDKGAWKVDGWRARSGLCGCTESSTHIDNQSCATGNRQCGDQYSGTFSYDRVRVCPSGELEAQNKTRDQDCQCEETIGVVSGQCPVENRDGKRWEYNVNKGNGIKKTYKHNCNTKQCELIGEENECGCAAVEGEEEARNCGWGMEGVYYVQKNFHCPDGAHEPGYWDKDFEEVPGKGKADLCECHDDVDRVPVTCESLGKPAGWVGEVYKVTTLTCDESDPSKEPAEDIDFDVVEECHEPPPARCEWVQRQGHGWREFASGNQIHGESCDCDTEMGVRDSCSKDLRNGWRPGTCFCEVVNR